MLNRTLHILICALFLWSAEGFCTTELHGRIAWKLEAKRKGKSGTKKAEGTGDGEDEEGSKPRRITSESAPGLSMRRQLQYVKAFKEMQKPRIGPGFVKKKQFHRSANDSRSDEERREERRENAKDVLAEVGAAKAKAVVVDGYNCIMKYPRLKKRMQRGDLAEARRMLVEGLDELAGTRGWRVTVVFDAAETKDRTERHTGGGKALEEGTTENVEVVYSPMATEADAVIERMAFEAGGSTGEGKMLVVTDDSLIRVAAGSSGATVLSCGLIIDELKSVRKAVMSNADRGSERASGQSRYSKRGWRIEDNVDLESIKRQIEERERRRGLDMSENEDVSGKESR